MILDVLKDAAIDTLKLIPFLLVTYFVMEYIEHKTSEKTQNKIQKAGRFGPIFGGIFGAVPQCGFSAAASNLYAGNVITRGTLIAIFLSTSDEMLPIFISERVEISFILIVLGIKILAGSVFGLLIDLFEAKIEKKHNHEHDHHHHIHEMCEHDHCNCEKNIFVSAFIHTLEITAYIFIFTFIIGLIIEGIGADKIANIVMDIPFVGELIAGLVGLIPNCAASVVITQLYLKGLIGFGPMMSGLLVGAGVGLFVLFKSNHKIKDNLLIVGLLYSIGVVAGTILGFIF